MTPKKSKFYQRDLSWLRFNHRVLQEAADERNPLYERIKFLAIFSSNLDEFFKVRVSNIRQLKILDKSIRKKLISKPNRLLKNIKQEVNLQQEWFGQIWIDQIKPTLADYHIFLRSPADFTEKQKKFADEFCSKLGTYKQLKVTTVGEGDNLHLKNERIYLVGAHHDQIKWMKLPGDQPRFIILPGESNLFEIAFLEDIIASQLEAMYSIPFYSIKASRDAELYILDEFSGDLVDKIKSSLPNRETGQITRVLYDKDIPDDLLNNLIRLLDVSAVDLVKGGKHHNLKDLFSFPSPEHKELHAEPSPPIRSEEWSEHATMVEAILSEDRLLHFPYQDFSPVINLINEAAESPQIQVIKITLYRISSDSQIAKALLTALRNGKEVFVFIETKARFDEENNLKWGDILKKKGAKVQFSYPGIKVHSKILYLSGKKDNEPFDIAYIGTGNFNEKTAKIYTDYALMTADPRISRDIKQVFEVLERKIIIPIPQSILLSPYNNRPTLMQLVEKEISNKRKGKDAYLILKMNSLEDPQMIQLLYKASRVGVQIRLIIRGICCLIPGITGQSENIYITSIIDRFLEHARVFIFANGGKEKMYIGSADWMTRNLSHRIEVVTPIYNKKIFSRIRQEIDIQLADNCKARVIDEIQSNIYVSKEGTKSSQMQIYDKYKSASVLANSPHKLETAK